MRFFRQSPAYLIISLLLLSTTWLLWSSQTLTDSKPNAILTSEDRARQALTEILGADNFRLYLTVENKVVVHTVEKKEYGEPVVQAEQSKIETLDRLDNDKVLKSYQQDPKRDNSKQYHYEVVSRNFLVGETKTYEFSSRTEIAKIRCLVMVKKDAWSKVESARSVLTSLLGVDEQREDKLTFEVEN